MTLGDLGHLALSTGSVTYTTLINALAKSNHLMQALDVFQSMQQEGVVPNVVTYNALINAWAKE